MLTETYAEASLLHGTIYKLKTVHKQKSIYETGTFCILFILNHFGFCSE